MIVLLEKDKLMSRTISENHKHKIAMAAEEADIRGLSSLAEHLTNQLVKTATRGNHEGYTYSHSDFESDVKNAFWDIVVRAEDYHGHVIDALDAEKLVETYAEEFIKDLRKTAGLKPVGKHEPKVPGEVEEK